MTNQATALSASLVHRVRERAARVQSTAGIPLVVLEEIQAEGLHLQDDAPLESAKALLVAAYRSAFCSHNVSRDDASVA